MSNETQVDIVLDFILDLANHIYSLTIYLQYIYNCTECCLFPVLLPFKKNIRGEHCAIIIIIVIS